MSLNVQSIIFYPQKTSCFQEFWSFNLHLNLPDAFTARARCLVFPQGTHDDSLQRQLDARELDVVPGIGQLLPVVASGFGMFGPASKKAMGFSGESRNHPCLSG